MNLTSLLQKSTTRRATLNRSTGLAMLAASALVVAAFGAPAAKAAGFSEVGFYTGGNASPHAWVETKGASTSYGINDGKHDTKGWKTNPFAAPVYYGLRYTKWMEEKTGVGWGLDLNHSKLIAKELPTGFRRLEFSDGMNTLIFNAYYRYKPSESLWNMQPYAGVGLGVAYPHVEVIGTSSGRTYDYQYTGLAFQFMGGLRKDINKNWSGFVELRSQYIPVKADLKGGGTLEANFVNNHLGIGINRRF